jgi:asparagine synthase (glutamine-hydrolysing)
LPWKNAGRLESRLIARFHHGIANQPSSYGFRFSDGPGRRARLTEWANCMRPVFARPLINAARRRLHKIGTGAGMIVHYRSLLPGEWRLDPVLDLGHLPDNAAFSRALAVEIAWRELVA